MSAYALTVEPGTPLGRAVAAGERAAPDDDDQATKYEIADDRLAEAGFDWYEISNWALPGEECRHNLLYWEQGVYAGIGCAAHGHTEDETDGPAAGGTCGRPIGTWRPWLAGDPTEAGDERLDPATREAERLTLMLRTRDGIKLRHADADLSPMDTCIDDLCGAGLLETRGDRATLTRRGRLLANEVVARLLTALDVRPSAPAGTR